jgi:hypothetical protein
MLETEWQLTPFSLAVSMRFTVLNDRKFEILPQDRIYVFPMDPRKQSDCFLDNIVMYIILELKFYLIVP